jgi:nucleotide-binding universal stress UspA family protein
MNKPIVVGLDPLHRDLAPLHMAAALARVTEAPLIAVATYLRDRLSNAVSGGTIERDLRAFATRQLKQLAEPAAEIVVAGGPSPSHVLHDVATDRAAAMLVVGSTRRGPAGRLSPGSTAERLLHGTPCPVAVAVAGLSADWEPRRIGVGFIDIAEGQEALRAGTALAVAAGGSLTAITAVEPLSFGRSAIVQPYQVGGGHEEMVRTAKRSLDAALESVPSAVRAEGQVRTQEPVSALVALSRDVDLIVCGSRGYGPLRSVMLGGVAHRLVRAAECPVLLVPRGTEQRLERVAAHAELSAS